MEVLMRVMVNTYIFAVRSEPMVDTSRKNLQLKLVKVEILHMLCAANTHNQIILLQPYANPFITLTPYIEEPSPISNISDLFILMQMLIEEHLYFLLVNIAHLLRRDRDYIAILVASLCGELVDIVFICEVVVENS